MEVEISTAFSSGCIPLGRGRNHSESSAFRVGARCAGAAERAGVLSCDSRIACVRAYWQRKGASMVLGAIGRFAKHHPFKFGCAFSCAKTSFSDWLVQTQIEKRERIDWKRNGTFAAFGLFYLGGVQYSIYVPIFSRLFPGAAAYSAAPLAAKLKDVAGTRNMLLQVGILCSLPPSRSTWLTAGHPNVR